MGLLSAIGGGIGGFLLGGPAGAGIGAGLAGGFGDFFTGTEGELTEEQRAALLAMQQLSGDITGESALEREDAAAPDRPSLHSEEGRRIQGGLVRLRARIRGLSDQLEIRL